MRKDVESGKKRRRSGSGRGSGGGGGSGFFTFFGVVLLFTFGGLALWALIRTYQSQDNYCQTDCCKTTQVYEEFDFSDPENFCIDRSTADDDESCPFKFFPISDGLLDGADGEFEVGFDTLFIDSTPFTLTVPLDEAGPVPFGGLDHVKFLAYISDQQGNFRAYPTHSTGSCADATELVYEGNVTCQVDLDFDDLPYDVWYPSEDYRLAACGFNSIAFQDFNNGVGRGAWQVADFFITNKAIFIINERLPFGKPLFEGGLNDYASFTQVTKVAQRKPSDYHKLAIVYNAAKNTIRYLIDDKEVYKVTRPGYYPHRCETALYHGGEEEFSFPDYVSFGFGTFTILDAYQWNNGNCEGGSSGPLAQLESNSGFYYDPHHFGDLEPTLFDDYDWQIEYPNVTDRVWGQGANMGLDYLRVYNRKCGCSQ